ncbi:MAG TPA: biotin/lipoate A/B protein ligase family protein [Chloroflexia bacterium]|nr:biotin/lipoate A/B protein ligase family protein [Chloroflexia bacterium]
MPATNLLVTPGANCYNEGERPTEAARPFAYMTVSLQPTPTQAPLRVESWRLLAGFDVPGPLNMALDEALLDSVIAGGVPVLRFYTWRPATLSLGTNQALGEIDRAACEARGFGVVRRLTGGRAVLHQHELTYSLIARENDPRVSGGVVESYRKISAALVEGLRTLGATVSLAAPDKALLRAMSVRRAAVLDEAGEAAEAAEGSSAVCFDAASAYELTAGGKKLVGSAQARRGGALLQHGSILLDIDLDAWVSVFAYASEAGKRRAYTKLPERMTSLRHELGRAISPEEALAALVPAFERTLSISLEGATLDPAEEAVALRLAAEKYGSEEWTARR